MVACFFVECMQRLAYNIVIEELLLMERKKVVGMQKMPTGVDNFRILREKNYYFVDKTYFIKEIFNLFCIEIGL